MFVARILFILLIQMGFVVVARAQYVPPPPPRPDPEIERRRQLREIRRSLDALDRLASSPGKEIRRDPLPKAGIVLTQYRRSTADEMKLLAPDAVDAAKYAKFLKGKETGLMKIVSDLGCDKFSIKTSSTGICDTFSMPGGGSAYSFRQKDYQIWKLADVVYDGRFLLAFGQMSQGFFLDLDNKSLTDIDRRTAGLEFMYSFDPASDFVGSGKQNDQFVEGLVSGGLEYKKFVPAIEGRTYAFRSIAYNGNAPQTDRGVKYNELDVDKRKDVIVAFTIVRKDFNGTLTLLWKILQSKTSPMLK